MTDREALLAAILANREDDTPRLVFADCLDENGESERAEFIRLQVELAQRPDRIIGITWCCDTCQTENGVKHHSGCPILKLRRRERELLDKNHVTDLAYNRTAWALPIRGDWSVDFSRGFVSVVTCSWSDWLAHVDAIIACQPVERVKFTVAPNDDECIEHGAKVLAREDRPSLWTFDSWPRIEFEFPPVRGWEDLNVRVDPIYLTRDLAAAENL